jgi:uncharacterized protein YbjT (DUF2867 family)
MRYLADSHFLRGTYYTGGVTVLACLSPDKELIMIVVTGATGNVGKPLVAALAEAGEDVVAVARRPAALPAGVRPAAADLTRPDSLKPVLEGADAVFLLLPAEALASPGHHAGILSAVQASGAQRVVLLSSQAAGTRPGFSSHAPLRALEDAIRQPGRGWTILRPGGFDSNALMWAGTVRSRRAVIAPFGDVGLPLIDPGDIAAAAAVVLRGGSRHAGRIYELTGPAPISPREQVAALGQALGEPVQFTEQGRAEARAQLLRFMPEPVADGTLAILGQPTAAEQRVSPHLEQILGRPPRTFTDWASRNVAAFR